MPATPPITVVETASFAARAAGLLSEAEREALIDMIAYEPACGDVLVGGGGIRKVRFAIGGRGKSGGVRVIYYFRDERIPVFLLTLFAKNERANLSRAEIAELGKAAKTIATSYGA